MWKSSEVSTTLPDVDRGEYRIGTVSKLTGVDPHTIRAWERRYGAIVPKRTDGGTRLYGDEDVRRLRLLKAVTDAGDAIGVVANLEDGDLRARLSALAGVSPEPAAPSGPPRLGLLGRGLVTRVSDRDGLNIVLDAERVDELLRLGKEQPIDVLVAHLPALEPAPAINLERVVGALGVSGVIVLYEFASRRALAELSRRGATLLRGPLPTHELETSLQDLLAVKRAPRPSASARSDDEEPPERLFDDLQLTRLRDIASSVQCECPNHLATLVESLVAFEEYSRRCESADPEDEALHGRLRRGTGRARAVVEALLVDLIEYDDLTL